MAVTYVPCTSADPLVNGNDLHTQIALANPGDILELDHWGKDNRSYGVTSALQFTDKGASTSYITLRPKFTLGSLPAGTMVTLADANNMARIETRSVNSPSCYIQNKAHHWAFQGIDFTAMSFLFTSDTSNLLGDLWQCDQQPNRDTTFSPHHFTFDRCMWHCNSSEHGESPYKNFRSVSRGGHFGGAHLTWTDCHFFDFWGHFPAAMFWDAFGFPTGNTDNILGRVTNIVMSGGKARVTFASVVPWPKDSTGSSFAPKQGLNLFGGIGTWSDVNQTFVGTPISPTFNAGLDRWETDTVDLETYHPTTFALTSYDVSGFGSFSTQFVTSGPNTGAPRIVMLPKSYVEGLCASTVAGPGPWIATNTRFEGFTYPIFYGGGTQNVPSANNVTVTSSSNPIDQVTLSGIGNLAVGDLIAFRDAEAQPVTGCTKAKPCVITVAPHRWPIGSKIWNGQEGVALFGLTGEWAFLNHVPDTYGDFQGFVIDSTHIELYNTYPGGNPADGVDTTGITEAFPSSGVTWTLKTNWSYTESTIGTQEWQIGKVTNISHSPTPNRITYDFHGHGYYTAPHFPRNAGGNGAGQPVAAGSQAIFNGVQMDGATFERCTFATTRTALMVVMHDIVRENVLGPKGLWELKSGRNITANGCIFEVTGGSTYPKPTMNGIALVLVTQGSSEPWVNNDNLVFTNCVFRDVMPFAGTFPQEYNSGLISDGLLCDNCLFYSSAPSMGLFYIVGARNASFKHCTYVGTSFITNNTGAPMRYVTPVGFQDCILTWGVNGFQSTDPLDLDRVSNLLVGPSSNPGSPWTPTDDWVPNIAAVKFVDPTGASGIAGFELQSDSPAKGAASDSKDQGVDFALLYAALTGGAVTLGVDAGAYALSGAAAILTGPPPPVTPLTYPGGSFTNRVFRVVRS